MPAKRIAAMGRSYRSLYRFNFYIKQRVISCLMRASKLAPQDPTIKKTLNRESTPFSSISAHSAE